MIFNTKLNKAFIKSTVHNELLMCNSICSVVHNTLKYLPPCLYYRSVFTSWWNSQTFTFYLSFYH